MIKYKAVKAMGIGKIIYDLRIERGISQKELAEAIGVSQSTIAKLEVGRNEATASTIRKLAKFFDVSADYLLELEDLGSSGMPAPATAEERKILENFRRLSPELKKIATDTLKLWTSN